MVSSHQASIEEALAKASEFMKAGMSHIGILATDGTLYTEREIDLLVEIERRETASSGLPHKQG